jgi:hypothetical protein
MSNFPNYHRGCCTVMVVLAAVMGTFGAASLLPTRAQAQAYNVAKTKEGVQRKAVITAGKGKLYNAESGDNGSEVGLMDVFFILEWSGSGTRIPVAREPDKSAPDGWLDKDSFAEWNTLQMVDFAPQGGREVAEVYDNSKCAIDFSRSGKSICKPIGKEPDRQSQTPSYKILVPVFKSDKDNATVAYEGGFVRVTPGQVAQYVDTSKLPNNETASKKKSSFELVLAIDSTMSMKPYFRATLDAVSDFVSQVQADLNKGEVKEAIRIGLLFYQDRKIGTECQLDYITQWRVPLTAQSGAETVDDVKTALGAEQEASCGSDEAEEAVFDGINRAINDPAWQDGSFRVVAVIGDADPHFNPSLPIYEKKNPLHLTTQSLHVDADAKNVRLLAMRIVAPGETATEFDPLALQRREELKGRFQRVPADPIQMRQNLAGTLWKEWSEIVKPARELEAQGMGKKELRDAIGQGKIQLSDYAYPIILNMLPDVSSSAGSQSFSRGWVPEKILEKVAVNEFVFMKALSIRDLVNLIDTIVGHMEEGASDGPDAFVSALRDALAAQLKVKPEEVFAQGEPLSSILYKAKILPFETGVLRFTAAEINQWRAEDYKRVLTILKERNTTLREFIQVAGNIRQFGSVRYYYVPQNLFP